MNCNALNPASSQSRDLHENGLRHKGNLERYIRDIYKQGHKAQKEKAEEAREIAKINAVSRSLSFSVVPKLILNNRIRQQQKPKPAISQRPPRPLPHPPPLLPLDRNRPPPPHLLAPEIA
jgi:hypothetical protein